jgi:hypothetical protein
VAAPEAAAERGLLQKVKNNKTTCGRADRLLQKKSQ